MTVGRHRTLRLLTGILEIIQIVLYLTCHPPVRHNVSTSVDFLLLCASLPTQALAALFVYPIHRSYDFRGPDNRRGVESVLNAPVEYLDMAEFLRTTKRVNLWAFHIFYLVDFIFRVARIVLLCYLSVSPVVLLCFCEQIVYFLGSLQYVMCLLIDQDYLRNVMMAMDLLTNRIRETGYHHVYSCGFQLTALPGMLLMSSAVIYTIFAVVPLTVMLTILFSYFIFDSNYSGNDLQFDGWLPLLLIDWLLCLIALNIVPMMFWLEDDPNGRYLFCYRIASYLGGLYMTSHLLFKAFIVFALHRSDTLKLGSQLFPFSGGSLRLAAITMVFFMLGLYLFVFGIWLVATVSFYEYQQRRSDGIAAWMQLFGITETSNSLLQIRFPEFDRLRNLQFRSHDNLALCQMVVDPFTAIAIGSLGNNLTIWCFISWAANAIFFLIIVVRSNQCFYRKARWIYLLNCFDMELERLVLPMSMSTLSVVSFVFAPMVGNWETVFLILSNSIRMGAVIWWFYIQFSGEPEEIPRLQASLWSDPPAKYGIWRKQRDIFTFFNNLPSSQMFENQQIDDLQWLKIMPREELLRLHFQGVLLQLHGRVALDRLRELNFQQRKMLLLLAWCAKSRYGQPDNLIIRIKDHNQYLIQNIAEYL